MTKSFDINLELLKKLDRIHPYPAKFTIDLALEYIQNYSRQNDSVLDPFCGSGTTLLACKALKRKGLGFDINFIAGLISNAKLLDLDTQDIQILQKIKANIVYEPKVLQHYTNINHWFKDEAIHALSSIKEQIQNCTKNNQKHLLFLQLIFSSIINIVSNQDSDTRYASPHINREYIFEKFNEKLRSTLDIYIKLKTDKRQIPHFFYIMPNTSYKRFKKTLFPLFLLLHPIQTLMIIIYITNIECYGLILMLSFLCLMKSVQGENTQA